MIDAIDKNEELTIDLSMYPDTKIKDWVLYSLVNYKCESRKISFIEKNLGTFIKDNQIMQESGCSLIAEQNIQHLITEVLEYIRNGDQPETNPGWKIKEESESLLLLFIAQHRELYHTKGHSKVIKFVCKNAIDFENALDVKESESLDQTLDAIADIKQQAPCVFILRLKPEGQNQERACKVLFK